MKATFQDFCAETFHIQKRVLFGSGRAVGLLKRRYVCVAAASYANPRMSNPRLAKMFKHSKSFIEDAKKKCRSMNLDSAAHELADKWKEANDG